MLTAALENASIPSDELDFIKRGLARAISYSPFRNRIVHGETIYDHGPSGTVEDAKYVLSEGSKPLEQRHHRPT